MECYQAEKDRLFRICHDRNDVAFICMSPLFYREVENGLCPDMEGMLERQGLMSIPVLKDVNTQGCFELILKEAYFNPFIKRFQI